MLATEAKDLEPRELLDNLIEFLLSNLSFFLCLVLVAQQQHTWNQKQQNENDVKASFNFNVIEKLLDLYCKLDLISS